MSATQTLMLHEQRDEPGLAGPVALALAVHLLLFLILFFGVQWQSRPPVPIVVELWSEAPAPQSKPEPTPEPRVEPRPQYASGKSAKITRKIVAHERSAGL